MAFFQTLHAADLTTTNVQAAGANWTAAIWRTNGLGNAVAPVAGNQYVCVSNGVLFGNNTSNTRIRNPTTGATTTFPGDSLTLTTNTELRIKGTASGPILNFPGVNGNPGLILNGGVLNVGDDTVLRLDGKIQVTSQAFISPADVGAGAVKPLRALNILGQLTGTGTVYYFQGTNTVAHLVSGTSNTFSGRWVIKAGWVLTSGTNSLGTNDITVDPGYVLPLEGNIPNVAGPAWFEPGYDLNSAGRLTLANGGIMILHQNCIFSSAVIQGVTLSPGTHSYAELVATFPSNFATGGSGSLTIQPYGPPPSFPPLFTSQPYSFALPAGSWTQLVATASGQILTYQWQKGTNSVFVNLSDGGDVSGSRANALTFSSLSAADTGDYRLIASNTAGSATSQVATVTVLAPDTSRPTVTGFTPTDGTVVGTLTQLQVTFSEPVLGIEPADLLINGTPATAVSGTGATYTFFFTQPQPGLVSAYWDVDHGITDLLGNSMESSSTWSWTLRDGSPPIVLSTSPPNGATVASFTQAEVLFSEAVAGVDASDLLVNGAPALEVTGSGFGPYYFRFPVQSTGNVNLNWHPAHDIRDVSSNLLVPQPWSVAVQPGIVAAALTNLVINEFLSANVSTNGLKDEDGQLNDWIELFNRSSTSINLTGWRLTDDPDIPDKWSMPVTNLGPGQFLVLFASGNNRRTPGSALHTSFKLNSEGDYLGLFSADLVPQLAHAYTPEYPEQRNDISFGLGPGGTFRYFDLQTPGARNADSTVTGAVAQVSFSVKHGFFNRAFNLILTTTTPGAEIVYTTDGSQPVIRGGQTNGAVFVGPIPVNRTTVVRAAGFAAGHLPSKIESRTYIFPEDVIRQPNDPAGYPTGYVWTPVPGTVQNGSRAYYQMDPKIVNDPQYSNTVQAGLLSIPTMSLVLPIPDLFDAETGIYTHPESRGPAWERACSMELLFPDGAENLQIDCGLQIQGGTQREPGKNPKHSMRVSFKGDYGPGRLDYRMFKDSPLESYNTLVIDGGINMWWHYVGGSTPADQRYRAQCVRDQFTSDLMLGLGQPAFHGQFYHVYLNGLYWGLHYIHERPDDDFAASYLGGTVADYDVLRTTTIGLEVVAGSADAWNAALALSNTGLTNNAQYYELQQYVDIDNLIDYMIVNHWVANEDWPHHNWYVIRKRSPGEGFRFIVWDAEHVLKTTAANRTTADAAGSPARIYNSLRSNAEFRLRFADRLQRHFFEGGLFYTADANAWNPAAPDRNVPAAMYMRRIGEISTAIADESARWGGYLLTTNYTPNDHWLRELNNLLGLTNNPGNTANFFPTRTATVLNQYKSIGLFPSVSAPLFSHAPGAVPPGTLVSITNQNTGGTIYYTTNGSDPRVYGSGTVSQFASAYNPAAPVLIDSTTVLNARVLHNGTWSALKNALYDVSFLGLPLRITEIMYKPIGGDAYEFIEIQNIGTNPVDLSGCRFSGISYVFPDGTSIGPGGVMLFASSVNPSAFAVRYPEVSVAGYFGGALSNNGERIALIDSLGSTIISVEYSNASGWPMAADTSGHSLEILNPDGDPDDPANWRASASINGSPGLLNSRPGLPSVRLSEVMADNAGAVTNSGTFPDWLEIVNFSPNPVNLASWSLSVGGNPRQFVFPTNSVIQGNSYLVVWCDTETNAAGLHSGFTLGRKGEGVFLYDATTNRVDAVGFGLQIPNFSLGRVGQEREWKLTLPTPWKDNLEAPLASPSNLFVNEWLANALPGGADWLELFNLSPSLPAALSGLYLSTSNDLFQIRSLSFVPPRGFVQLFADENPGADHVDFKLSAGGDSLVLRDLSGQHLDAVQFALQAEGVSQGRLPDGSSNIAAFPGTASPGASNYVGSYSGPVLNEIMARNVSAVFDSAGNNPDWLELHNPTVAAFPLGGIRMSLNSEEWVFPMGSSIAAGGFLRVWCDPSRPGSTNATAELNTGFALPAEGARLSILAADGRIFDSVQFGFQVADLSIGRDAGKWALLQNPTPGSANSSGSALGRQTNLRINEWMADPLSGNDWLELYSQDSFPVSLSGLYLTDEPSITGMTNFQLGPLSFVGPSAWVLFQADGDPSQGPDHAPFSLKKEGEALLLCDANLQAIDAIDFGLQVRGNSQGRLPDGAAGLVPFQTTQTPRASNYLPLTNVVVNEVLTHTDAPFEDAIELYNMSGLDVLLDGWFLSNSESNLRKLQIPAGTFINARSYKVFYEWQFNSSNAAPFTLNSAHGDAVYLSQTDAAGNLTGYRAQVSFGASENRVSWGRFQTSAGTDFVPLVDRSFGADNPGTVAQFRSGNGLTNSPPKIGPVIISEIMYHPVSWAGTNLVEIANEEYVEVMNMSAGPVELYDPSAPQNRWSLSGAIDFVFPGGLVLAPGMAALVVRFNPETDTAALQSFRSRYDVATSVPILGPYSGRLDNSGENVVLCKPDKPQAAPHPDAGFVPTILVDQVNYGCAAPWPDGADGTGHSLQRKGASLYGNEPLNWLACTPTPGRVNCGADFDGDGLPDDWELAYGLDPGSGVGDNGPDGDPDRDGFRNLDEFIAGTDPRDPDSCLSLTINLVGSQVELQFNAITAHSYTVQYRESLATGAWLNFHHLDATATNARIIIPDGSASAQTRYYRLVTPRLP